MRQSGSVAEVMTVPLGAGDLQYGSKPPVRDASKDGALPLLRFTFEKGYLHKQTGLKFKEETSKVLRLEHSFVWC
jgi:hypothetical protein